MYLLNQHVELDTNSTLYAIFIFSVISVFCSTITIIIYFKIKSLRTLIYRFFFHVAFNEWLSRLSYLILFIAEIKGYNIHMFRISANLIIFTDTNIILLVTFTCFGMHQLILKQDIKLSEKFNKISIILYSISLVLTALLYGTSFCHKLIDNNKNYRDTNLYRNVVCLFFITDYYNESLPSILIINCIYIPLLIASFVFIFLIQAFVKDRAGIVNINEGEDDIMDKSIKSSLKLRTFKLKLLLYPILNLFYILPLLSYIWIEYYYLFNYKTTKGDINMLRVRYSFYNIYCFMNSIRGYIFFYVFLDNEKIKEFFFKKYLYFDLFKTIDQLKEEEAMSNERSSESIERTDITHYEKEIDKNIDSNFDINENIKESLSYNTTKSILEEKDKKMIELETNQKKTVTKPGLINDEDEDDSSDDDEDDDKEKKKLKT